MNIAEVPVTRRAQLSMLLAPYLRKYGKYTVPMFVGERYYSQGARVVAVICAIFVSFTYVAGQMRGVGVVFSRFLEVPINTGVLIGMAIVFFYAVLGGMKGITYTQVAQYCVLIMAYLIPAIFISIMLTGNPIPQLGYGSQLSENGMQLLGTSGGYLLDKLNGSTARLICASSRNMDEMIGSGEFDPRLYYRISAVGVRIPALREHREDVGLPRHVGPHGDRPATSRDDVGHHLLRRRLVLAVVHAHRVAARGGEPRRRRERRAGRAPG